jgi:hypothetical protein
MSSLQKYHLEQVGSANDPVDSPLEMPSLRSLPLPSGSSHHTQTIS